MTCKASVARERDRHATEASTRDGGGGRGGGECPTFHFCFSNGVGWLTQYACSSDFSLADFCDQKTETSMCSVGKERSWKGQGSINGTGGGRSFYISINEERSEWKEFCSSRSIIRDRETRFITCKLKKMIHQRGRNFNA